MPMASRASTQEEYVKQQDVFQTTYRQWMNATAAECQAKFAIPLAEVMDDMHAEKLDPGPFCNLFNGNLFAVQECATSIGVLAQKLSR